MGTFYLYHGGAEVITSYNDSEYNRNYNLIYRKYHYIKEDLVENERVSKMLEMEIEEEKNEDQDTF